MPSRVTPYPLLTTGQEFRKLPERKRVECAQCLDFEDVDDEQSAREWAERHSIAQRSLIRRGHERFRLVAETRWSVEPF